VFLGSLDSEKKKKEEKNKHVWGGLFYGPVSI
jgi:hypothetical protein